MNFSLVGRSHRWQLEVKITNGTLGKELVFIVYSNAEMQLWFFSWMFTKSAVVQDGKICLWMTNILDSIQKVFPGKRYFFQSIFLIYLI